MMINIKIKREYASNISRYLLELETLASKAVNKDDLSSIKQVDEVRVSASHLENLPIEKFKIGFSEKDGSQFSRYIQGLYYSNSEQVYVWTGKTNSCGLYKVSSIKDVNFSFPFNLNEEGIVAFLSVDMKDKLLLDFSIESSGDKIVDVESQGLNWPNVKYILS